MATATFSGAWGKHLTLEVNWRQVRQNIAGNNTTIHVDVFLRSDSQGAIYGAGNVNLAISGDASDNVSVSPNIGYGSRRQLLSRDFTIGHNPDGKKSFRINVGMSINVSNYGSASTYISGDLTRIHRASTVKSTGGDLGKPITITINRSASSFTHTVRYNWDGRVGTIATGVATSVTWTPPLSFAETQPGKTTHFGTIMVDTYSGSTKIGTSQTPFTMTIPESVKPTLSGITLRDTNAKVAQLLNSTNTFIKILSSIAVDFNGASGSYGSTITGYYAEIENSNMSTNQNGGTLLPVNIPGPVAFVRAYVIDSRGRRSDMITQQINMLEYFSPVLSFSAQRSGSQKDILTINRIAKVAPLTVGGAQKNTMKLSFKVARYGTDAYATNNGPASGEWSSISELVNSKANLADTFSASTSWRIIGTLEDKFTKSEFSLIVSPEKVVLSYDQTGIGVGKPREFGVIDSAGDIYANGKRIQHYELTGKDGFNVATSGTDLNTLTKTGFYVVNKPVNAPDALGMANEWHVWVVSENNGYLGQIALHKGIKRGLMYTRTKHDWSGGWGPWFRYATVDDEWKPAGAPNSFYKKEGSLITIRYNFQGTGDNVLIADLPPDVFTAAQSYMQVIADWETDGSKNTHVQINSGESTIRALSTTSGKNYVGQLHITV